MTNAEYFLVATDVFLPPENPGLAATSVAEMTGMQIARTGWLRTAATRIYRTYHKLDQAFKKILIDIFKDQYLNALSDEIVAYENCTSLQLITHILMYYATPPPWSSRRTFRASTHHMILTNQLRISFNKFRMIGHLRWPVDNLVEMR
jgi:hypothetical protein